MGVPPSFSHQLFLRCTSCPDVAARKGAYTMVSTFLLLHRECDSSSTSSIEFTVSEL